MKLPAALARWRTAGLIDATTEAAIARFEASRRPAHVLTTWVLWLGALAVALGLVSLVASNWDRIPDAVKLSVHAALNAGAAVLAWWLALRGRVLAAEITGLLLFALTLTGIALIGQVYQVAGETWAALLLWISIGSPFVLLLAHSRFLAWLWLAVLCAGLSPSLAAARPKLAETLRLGGAIVVLFAGNLAAEFWGRSSAGWERLAEHYPALLAACGAAAVAVAALPRAARGVAGPPIVAVCLLTAGALVSPDDDSGIGAALLVVAFWGLILRQALLADRLWLARLAVILIALRLLLLFVTALGGLANTGWVLLAGGAVALATAAALRRVRSRPT